MAEYGVLDTGFKRKPKSVIISETESLMLSKFGQDTDVSAESPEGNFISVVAEIVAPLWELAEHAYNAFNPNAATGVTLENVCLINNIKKKTATATTVTLKFTGTSGILIPAGTSVSSNPDLTGGTSYTATTNSAVTLVDGTASVLATLSVTGAIQIAMNSMTILDVPIVGVTGVTNESAGNVGLENETDPEIRSRRTSQVALPSVSTVDSIRAGILDIDTVVSCKVYENDTGISTTEDGVTLEPHSIKAIIQGAATEDEKSLIANEFLLRKDPGIVTSGSVEYTLQDSQGFDKTFKWDTPTLVPIYIVINTDADTAYDLPGDGDAIREAIIEYIEDPVTGYTIGDDVSYARLFTPINSVSGHKVQSMYIGTSPNPTTMGDINIDGGSLAVITDPDNDIVIEIDY